MRVRLRAQRLLRRPERSDPRKVELLRRIPILAGADGAVLAGLGSQLDVIDVDAGRVLVREGRVNHGVVLVVEGRASMHRHGRDVAVAVAGDVLGGPGSATVVASTPMRVLVAGPAFAADVLARLDAVARQNVVPDSRNAVLPRRNPVLGPLPAA